MHPAQFRLRFGPRFAAETGTGSGGTEAEGQGQGEAEGEAQGEGEAEDEAEDAEGEAAAAAAEPTPKPKPWFSRRIDELTGDKHRLTRELQLAREALAARVAAPADDPPADDPPADPPARKPAARPAPSEDLVPRSEVEAAAAAMIAENHFAENCNSLVADGKKEFGASEWETNVTQAYTDLGGMPRHFVEAAMETGLGHKVLFEIGKDKDEAMRVLRLPPLKMAVELERIASRLKTPKKTSDAPPPPRQVGGKGRGASVNLDDPETPMDVWIKERQKEAKSRGLQ